MMSLLLPACRLAACYYCLFFHFYCSTATDALTAADAAIGENHFGFGASKLYIITTGDIVRSAKPIECVALESRVMVCAAQ